MTRSIGILAGAKAGDLVLIVAGQGGLPAKETARRAASSPCSTPCDATSPTKLELADPNTLAFLWVVDFPLFDWSDEDERWDPAHHLFTSARAEDLAELDT